MITGGFLGSLTNYIYHIVMARTLGPKDYGVLESLISIIYQLGVPLTAVSLVITKYVSFFKGKERTKTINSFFWKLTRRLFKVIPIALILTFLAASPVAKFLHLPSPNLFILVGLTFISGIFGVLTRSFLQGLSKFIPLSVSGFLEGLFRLTIAIIFVFLNLKLFGAIFSIFTASVFGLLLTSFFLREIILGKKENEPIPEKKEILKFFFPAFFTNLGIMSLITSDVILVRHFFPAFEAGIYSGLSTLGKIIFFAASPIMMVTFPQISESHAANRSIKKVIIPSIIIAGIIILSSLAIFGFFPKTMVYLLLGDKYSEAVPFVFYFGIIMSLYTINAIFLNMFLALKITLPSLFVSLAAISQIILIIFFHNSIWQVINIFIIICSLLLITLLLYYWYVQKKATISYSTNI